MKNLKMPISTMTASVQDPRAGEEEDILHDNLHGEENEDADNPNQEEGLHADLSKGLKMGSNWYEDEHQPG